MKNIVICFDGTWNTLDAPQMTNVVKAAQLVTPTNAQGCAQVVHYDEGVGSGNVGVARRTDRALGGAFGVGLLVNVERAYRFLAFNYAQGDKIFILGFSRGAFSARALGGLIRKCGILSKHQVEALSKAISLYKDKSKGPDSPEACQHRKDHSVPGYFNEVDQKWRLENRVPNAAAEPRLTIEYIGVWDTVEALGVPNYYAFAKRINDQFRFYDLRLSSAVQSARHALAIDEHRRAFEATPWENIDELNERIGAGKLPVSERPYQQQWFPGDHGSIGGGGLENGISNQTLAWVIEGARRRGLGIDEAQLAGMKSSHRAPLLCMTKPSFDIMSLMLRASRPGPTAVKEDLSDISEFARLRFAEPRENLPERRTYRPKTLKSVANRLAELAAPRPPSGA